MSAPVHGARRNGLLCLCLVAAACQLFATVFVDPFVGFPQRASKVPRSAIPLGKLNIGDKYPGLVVSVTRSGAFVDFGCEQNGFVHISELRHSYVEDVYAVVSEGQEVEVWVKSVDIEDNKVGLTMVKRKLSIGDAGRPKADLSVFEPLIGEQITGIVNAVYAYAAFVEVEADGQVFEGFLHISELSNDYVEDARSFVSEGDEVKVTILTVDVVRDKMKLSLK